MRGGIHLRMYATFFVPRRWRSKFVRQLDNEMETLLKNSRNAVFRLLLREASVILVGMLMVGVALLLGQQEFIFPELAALSIGCLVIVKRVWCVDRWRTVVLLTGAALLGTLLFYSSLPFIAKIALGFSSVALLLILLRSSLYPALSACLLPLVLNESSWVYPLAVFLLALLLVGMQWLMEKLHLRTALPFRPVARTVHERIIRAVYLLIVVTIVVSVAAFFEQRFFILPPLIVLFVEFSRPEAGLRKAPFLITVLMAVAALLGNFGKLFLEPFLGLSPVLSMGSVLLLLFVVFSTSKRYFAPAAAIAVLPQILQQDNWYLFPIEVTLATALFIAIALLFFRAKRTAGQN